MVALSPINYICFSQRLHPNPLQRFQVDTKRGEMEKVGRIVVGNESWKTCQV